MIVNSFATSFENKGIVELVSKLAAVQIVGTANPEAVVTTAQLLREQALASMFMQSTIAKGTGKALIENLARALQEQGRFELTFTPKVPVNLNAVDAVEAVEAELQSSFTSAAQ